MQRSSSLTSAELPVACASCLAWRWRPKLLPRIACSRHRLLPGCDTPLSPPGTLVARFAYATARAPSRKVGSAKSQNPRQIICRVAIIRIKGQRLLPLFEASGVRPISARARQDNYARLYYLAEVQGSLPMVDRFIGFALLRQRSPSP